MNSFGPDSNASVMTEYDANDFLRWRHVVWMTGSILLLRVIYLIFLCPYELVADEAHYWEWSRRLDLSYYSKGPGVAWVIAASTAIFGDYPWAVRLPSALASAVMMLAGARLAYDMTQGNGRAAWYTAAALALAPGYFAIAQLMTTDVFYVAAWMVAAWCAMHAFRPTGSHSSQMLGWIGLGVALGVGTLFKYTMLLFLPGLVAFACFVKPRSNCDRTTLLGALMSAAIAGVIISPIAIWNARHGWPTVTHQLGRLALPGGDEIVAWSWSPWWGVEFIGAQLGLLGLVGAGLILLALKWQSLGGVAYSDYARNRQLLVFIAAPILSLYIGLSFFKHVQGNWAIAGYSTLLVLVGMVAARDVPRHQIRGRSELTYPVPQPKQRFSYRNQRSLFKSLWKWYLGVGVSAAIIIVLGPKFFGLPILNQLSIVQRIEQRLTDHRMRAQQLDVIRRKVAETHGHDPLIISHSYQSASLFAFYLPGNPHTYSARSYLGGRQSAYDYFADTNLASPGIRGRNAILVGSTPQRWLSALQFDSVESIPDQAGYFIARNYQGPLVQSEQRDGQ